MSTISTIQPYVGEGLAPPLKKPKNRDLDVLLAVALDNISFLTCTYTDESTKPIKKYQFSYLGESKDSQPNGSGKMTFMNGLSINGIFKDGKLLEDHVTMTYPNGLIYEGKVENFHPSGSGKMTLPGRGSFEGEYIPHEKIQVGIFYSLKGWKFEGEFSDMKAHGPGTLTFSNGNIQKCNWTNGAADGPVELIFPNQNIMRFSYCDNKINGHIKLTYPGGLTIRIKKKSQSFLHREGPTQNFKSKLS